jgi:hypothetical protein
MVSDKIMIKPPMVGVPDLLAWDWGPSFRTDSRNFKESKNEMSDLPKIKVMNIDVSPAIIARRVT